MKIFAFALLVLCALLAAEASPAKNKAQPKCDLLCPAVYTPVCAGVPEDKSVKPKLFGNECVLQLHNCQHKSNLVKLSEDKCDKAGGVRLL